MNKKYNDYMSVVGLNFFDVPGRYILPFHEGRYSLAGDGEIVMNVRGTKLPYIHQNVLWKDAS